MYLPLPRMRQTPFHVGLPSQVFAVVCDFSGTITHPFGFLINRGFLDTFDQEGIHLGWRQTFPYSSRPSFQSMQSLMASSSVAHKWKEAKGRFPTDEDTIQLFFKYMDTQQDLFENHTYALPYTKDVFDLLQHEYGVFLAATSEFPDTLNSVVQEKLEEDGVFLDVVTGSEYGARPKPFMLYECMQRLNVWPISSVVKVGDTVDDILEGKASGCWTVGVTAHSSMLNKYLSDWIQYEPAGLLSETKLQTRIGNEMFDAGADYVISTLFDLPYVVEEINKKLCEGKSPCRV